MNLLHNVFPKILRRNDSIAIVSKKDECFTYQDFYKLTTRISHVLHQERFNVKSKVLLIMDLNLELYAVVASLLQLGATVVLIDPWASEDYLKNALSSVNPTHLILSRKARFFLIKKSIRKIPVKLSLEKILHHLTEKKFEKIEDVSSDHIALMTFTSGTTGSPKAFERSHGFLVAQQKAHEKYFQHFEGEVDLSMYPVFVLSNLKSGVCSVLIKGDLRKIEQIDPLVLYDQIINHHVTSLTLSPALLEKLLNFCIKENLSLPVKKVFTGGAPVKNELCRKLMKLNPEIEGYVVYGSTEAEPIAIYPMKHIQEDSEALGAPLGKVVDDLQFMIESKDHKIHPFHPKEQIGEMIITGEYVGKKYANIKNPENKFKDNNGIIWHKTGDIVLQKNHCLYMLGRLNQGLLTTDGTIFPLPVELMVEKIQGVRKASYLQFKQQIFLVFEGTYESISKIESLFKKKNLPVDQIIPVENIPTDSRHRSKIDQGLLKLKLEQFMLTENSSLFKKLFFYSKERFPLLPIMVFVVLLTSGHANYLSVLAQQNTQWMNPKMWIVMATVFLFMIQLRMSDELKDFKKDKIAYPERILSRGLISLSVIKAIALMTISFELVLSLMISFDALMIMLILQTWAYLMYKEFFLKEFLEKKTTLNLISHQLILLPLALLGAMPFVKLKMLSLDTKTVLGLLFLSLPYTVYEISRKTWSKDREHPFADSYTKSWGVSHTIWVLVTIICVLLILEETLPMPFSSTFRLLFWILSLASMSSFLLFKNNPTRRNSKIVELAGTLFVLLSSALYAFML